MKKKLATLYRDWFNNFLTVECFADYYCVTDEQAQRVINIGRVAHDRGY